MAILNEDMKELPEKWAKEFIGTPKRELFPAGTKMCKRVTANDPFNRLSEWWTLKKDWDVQNKRAASVNVDPASMVRARQAVRPDWQSNLAQPVYGQLMQSVYGFVGRARWQEVHKGDPKVVLMGGGEQVCIPNLTSSHLRVLHALV